VKKEAGKVVVTSNVVRSQATRGVLEKWARAPEPKNDPLKKGGPKNFHNFQFQNFETFKGLWRGASVDLGIFIAYFGGKM